MMKNKKVLVVEDEVVLSDAIVSKLKVEGFDFVVAKNGIEGLLVAEKENPDIILLDIIMPKMDGITMLKEMRKKDWGKNIPVIMLTNLSDDKKVAESMQQNVFDYLIKSNWKIEDIIDLIKEKLNLK